MFYIPFGKWYIKECYEPTGVQLNDGNTNICGCKKGYSRVNGKCEGKYDLNENEETKEQLRLLITTINDWLSVYYSCKVWWTRSTY